MIYDNALALIGNTSLIHLQNIAQCEQISANIYAKLESVNPGGSIKDRPALKIIQLAYQTHQLRTAQPVVEMTSGNMGSGLAVVCNLFRNPFIAVMSEGNSPARVKMLQSLGTEVVLVPQVDGTPLHVTGRDIDAATAKAIEISREVDGFYVDQFNHPGSVLAHFEGTGPEIWQDAADARFTVDAFVASVGSGGTFVGVSQFLKSKNTAIYCAAVEPEGASILAGNSITKQRHIIQGTGYGFIPPHWDCQLADGFMTVSDEEAVYYRKLLADKEGLDVGFSSGANVCAAVKLARNNAIAKNTNSKNANIVTILCDLGLKYV